MVFEGLAGSAAVAAAQAALQHMHKTREGRKRLNQIFSPFSGPALRAAKDWLSDPRTAPLLLSKDVEKLVQAELRLRDAVARAGEEPPDDLGPTVHAAQLLLIEQLPAAPEIRAVGQDMARQLETSQQQHTELLELSRATHADVAALVAHGDPRTRPLHPTIVDTLADTHDQPRAQRTARFLSDTPSRAGYDQHLATLEDFPDPAVWEAAAHYARLRGWHEAAQSAFQVAAMHSPHPERLLLWAAWQAKTCGADGDARALLEQATTANSGRFYRAATAFVEGRGFDEIDDLTFTRPDDQLVALIGIETLSKAGDNDQAINLVTQWRELDSTPALTAVEARLRWVRQGPVNERVGQLQLALDLAMQAWQQAHDFGLPARLAAGTAVQVAMDINEPERVRDVVAATNPYRGEELAESEVAAQAWLALEVLNEQDADLGNQLSEFDRRLFTLVQPVVAASDAPYPPVEQLRELQQLAKTGTQKIRALLLLARAGHRDSSGELEQLREDRPADAALVEAAYLSATGDPDGAAAKLRPFIPQQAPSCQELVHVYERAGRNLEAIDAAIDVWDHHRDPTFLTHAAGLLAAPNVAADAPDTAVERLRNAITEAQASLHQPARTAALLEALTVVYLNRGQFQQAATFANSLHTLASSDHSKWRVALCQVALGNHAEAWSTLAVHGAVPRPRSDEELRLLAALVHSQATEVRAVQGLLSYAPLAHNRDVEGIALLSAQGVLERCGADDELTVRVRDAIHAFATENPTSDVIQVLTIDKDDPWGSLTSRFPRLTRGLSEAERRFNGQVLTGRFPYTLVAAVVGKSPAQLLAARGGHPLHAASGNLCSRQRERAVVRAALGRSVALDITALSVLADLQAAGCPDLSAFVRPVVATPIAQDVASHANDLVGSGVFAPTTDPDAPATLIELSDEEQQQQKRRQETMQTIASRLTKEVVMGPLSVVEGRDDVSDGEYVAWAAAEAALRSGMPVWADDEGLRSVLRSSGVDSFSTRALTDVLLEQARIDPAQRAAVRAALRDAWVTDLPSTINEVIERLETTGYQPQDALAARLAGWWRMFRHTRMRHWITLFEKLAQQEAAATSEWFGNACVGLVLAERGRTLSTARFLLMLLLALPALRPRVDVMFAAANTYLWCVPAELTATEVVAAARQLAAEYETTPDQLLHETLADSQLGRHAREEFRRQQDGR